MPWLINLFPLGSHSEPTDGGPLMIHSLKIRCPWMPVNILPQNERQI